MNRFKILKLIIIILIIINTCHPILYCGENENNKKISKQKIKEEIYNIITKDKYQYLESELPENKPKKKNPFYEMMNNFINLLQKIFAKPLIIILIIGTALLIGTVIFFFIKNFKPIKNIKDQKRTNYQKMIKVKVNDYLQEFNNSVQLLESGKFKEALQSLMNSIWLFFNMKKIIIYNKSKTNREYLKNLLKYENYNEIKSIITKSEKAVYSGGIVDKQKCEKIFDLAKKIILQ